MRKTFWLLTLTLAIGSIGSILAQQLPEQGAAQDTKVNQRDRRAGEATADQQKDNHSDREVTKQIRRALVKDKSLSTYAHNVKIVARGGKVTLKGPVRSDEEKQAIEAKAVEIAGQGNVTNELQVAPKTNE